MDTRPLSEEPIVAVPTPSASERDDTMRGILAVALLASFLYVVTLFSLFKCYLEGEMQGTIIALLGGSALLSAIGWYYQGSSGSKSQQAQKEKVA